MCHARFHHSSILLPAVQTFRRNEGDGSCLAGHRNTAGWKDVKEEITDTAGNSHQCVLRLPNCAADVLRWGNPSLLEQQREASLFLSISTVLHPPPRSPPLPPYSLPEEWVSSACSVSLASRANLKVRKQRNASLYRSSFITVSS